MRIGLDAGHGGSSSGTYSVNTTKDGLFEKDYALELCLLVGNALKRNGYDVVFSRIHDINPGNVSQRALKMVRANVDFALSIHFNGFKNTSANGCEVFVPHQERYATIECGFKKVLSKYFKVREPFARSNSYYDKNITFDKKMNTTTNRFDNYDDQLDYFGFIRTCWSGGVSADLLEVCFLTNAEDFNAYIKNKDAIAEGIAKSIVEGFGGIFVSEKKPKPLNLKKVNLIK